MPIHHIGNGLNGSLCVKGDRIRLGIFATVVELNGILGVLGSCDNSKALLIRIIRKLYILAEIKLGGGVVIVYFPPSGEIL